MPNKPYPCTPSELAEVYRKLPGWTRGEVAGLTEAQLDRTGPEEWAWWSPRRQVSHMAYVITRWLMVLYGAVSLPWQPVDMSQFWTFINSMEDDRRFSAARYGDLAWLLARLEESCGEAAERAAGPGEEGKALLFVFGADARVGASPDRVVDLWGRSATCHPDGMARDPAHPHAFRMTPLAALRHGLWDGLIHLRSLRLHRGAMGLAPAHPEAPVGGYEAAYPVR